MAKTKLSKSENKLIQELNKKGYRYKGCMDIYRKDDIEPEVINTILQYLPKIYNEHYGTADILVRSLIGAKEPFDPSPLIKLFDESDLNYALKDSIATALAYSKTQNISTWLKDQLLNKGYAHERCVLVGSLNNKGCFKTEKELMGFVKKIFDKYHDEEVLKLFKKFGDETDVKFLAEQASNATSVVENDRHNIQKSLERDGRKIDLKEMFRIKSETAAITLAKQFEKVIEMVLKRMSKAKAVNKTKVAK
jgi:hypothetical protein